MVNEYTSIATTPGISTATVQNAYDLTVRAALRNLPTMRDFVTVRPDNPAMHGGAVIMTKYNYFSEATITALKATLGEETDVDSVKLPAATQVTLTSAEKGSAVTATLKLKNRMFAPVDPIIVDTLADQMSKVLDELIQDQLVSDVAARTVDGGAENALTAGDELTSSVIRSAVTRFRVNNVPTWDGQFYTAVVHPHTIHDLREEAGSGGWRVPKEYGDNNLLITGEAGAWEGVRFVVNNRVRHSAGGAASAEIYNNYFFGQGGLAELATVEPGVRVAPQVDKLGRFATVGWYADIGWKVYEPLAIQRIVSSSSLEAEA